MFQINQIYNFWQILEEPNPSSPTILCKCLKCNSTVKPVRKSKITSGDSKSCGCGGLIDQIQVGKLYGFWKVLNINSKRCTTFCTGCNRTTREVGTSDLIYGKTKSCGCQKSNQSRVTNLNKYGVEYPNQNKEVRAKIKETNLERYGVECPSQTEWFQQKVKKSSLEKRGVEHFTQDPEIIQKRKKTNLKKYGAESPQQTNSIKEKAKQTCLEKYNKEFASQTQQFQKNVKSTNLEKYGVENFSQLPANRNKLKEWCDNNLEKLFTSHNELEILSHIQLYYPSTKKYRRGGHELDIFIPELNLGIEHNGLYRHSELFKANNYHLNKTNYFKSQEIRTIHIWSSDWYNKQDQVKSFLLSALGKNEFKIGARKCDMVWSNSKEEITKAHELLDSTHIQGHTNSTKYVVNIYYNKELVATATFGKHHRNSKEWVLSRFTTKTNYTIQGILSKVSKLASKELQSDIISWADYRLSNGNGYEKAGWKLEELLRPDYFYIKSGNDKKVISKQSRQKKLVNTPKEMTEHEHAKLEGLLRVYDCGKIRYRFKKLTT